MNEYFDECQQFLVSQNMIRDNNELIEKIDQIQMHRNSLNAFYVNAFSPVAKELTLFIIKLKPSLLNGLNYRKIQAQLLRMPTVQARALICKEWHCATWDCNV